jgi:hypothetical protein
MDPYDEGHNALKTKSKVRLFMFGNDESSRYVKNNTAGKKFFFSKLVSKVF